MGRNGLRLRLLGTAVLAESAVVGTSAGRAHPVRSRRGEAGARLRGLCSLYGLCRSVRLSCLYRSYLYGRGLCVLAGRLCRGHGNICAGHRNRCTGSHRVGGSSRRGCSGRSRRIGKCGKCFRRRHGLACISLLHHRHRLAGQGRANLLTHHLALMVFGGLEALNTHRIQVKFNLVEPLPVHSDGATEIVEIAVTGRIVAHAVAASVAGKFFLALLLHLDIHAVDRGERQNVRVVLVKARRVRIRNHEIAVHGIDIHLLGIAEHLIRIEGRKLGAVRLALGKVLLHLRNGRLPAAREVRRHLLVAGTAHIAVLQLVVAEEADFLPANVTKLFVKQSHFQNPPYFLRNTGRVATRPIHNTARAAKSKADSREESPASL